MKAHIKGAYAKPETVGFTRDDGTWMTREQAEARRSREDWEAKQLQQQVDGLMNKIKEAALKQIDDEDKADYRHRHHGADDPNPEEDDMDTQTMIRTEELPRVKGMQELVLDALLQVMREREAAAVQLAEEYRQQLGVMEGSLNHEKARLTAQHQQALAEKVAEVKYYRDELSRSAATLHARAGFDQDLKLLWRAANTLLVTHRAGRHVNPKRRQMQWSDLETALGLCDGFLAGI
jgi:hypothetical protein